MLPSLDHLTTLDGTLMKTNIIELLDDHLTTSDYINTVPSERCNISSHQPQPPERISISHFNNTIGTHPTALGDITVSFSASHRTLRRDIASVIYTKRGEHGIRL
ncbi:hypothetical protein NPIL_93121, partial [Nephila pilipes]